MEIRNCHMSITALPFHPEHNPVWCNGQVDALSKEWFSYSRQQQCMEAACLSLRKQASRGQWGTSAIPFCAELGIHHTELRQGQAASSVVHHPVWYWPLTTCLKRLEPWKGTSCSMNWSEPFYFLSWLPRVLCYSGENSLTHQSSRQEKLKLIFLLMVKSSN